MNQLMIETVLDLAKVQLEKARADVAGAEQTITLMKACAPDQVEYWQEPLNQAQSEVLKWETRVNGLEGMRQKMLAGGVAMTTGIDRPTDLSEAEQAIWLSAYNAAIGRASPDLFNPNTYDPINKGRMACACDAADIAVVALRNRRALT